MSNEHPLKDSGWPHIPTDLQWHCLLPSQDGEPKAIFARAPGGDIVHVGQVDRGMVGLTCVGCDLPLVPVKGARTAHHFRHQSERDCTSAGETALHIFAKSLLERSMRLWLPEARAERPGGAGSIQVRKELWTHFDRIELEKWQDGIRPDLIGYIEGGACLQIEIVVTNAVSEEKRRRLAAKRISTIEIDLSGLPRDAAPEEITRAVERLAPRRWVYHRLVAEREARERERAKALQREAEATADRRRQDALAAWTRVPRGATPQEITRVAALRRRARQLGIEAIFDAEPRLDQAFEAPPGVWRARVVEAWFLAPLERARKDLARRAWNDPLLELTPQDLTRSLREDAKPEMVRLTGDDLATLRRDHPEMEVPKSALGVLAAWLVRHRWADDLTFEPRDGLDPVADRDLFLPWRIAIRPAPLKRDEYLTQSRRTLEEIAEKLAARHLRFVDEQGRPETTEAILDRNLPSATTASFTQWLIDGAKVRRTALAPPPDPEPTILTRDPSGRTVPLARALDEIASAERDALQEEVRVFQKRFLHEVEKALGDLPAVDAFWDAAVPHFPSRPASRAEVLEPLVGDPPRPDTRYGLGSVVNMLQRHTEGILRAAKLWRLSLEVFGRQDGELFAGRNMKAMHWPTADSTTPAKVVEEERRRRDAEANEQERAALHLKSKLEAIDRLLESEFERFGHDAIWANAMGRKGATWSRNRPVREACLDEQTRKHAIDRIVKTRGMGPW